MSNIILIGANHKTAPVEIREKLSFSAQEALEGMESLRQNPYVKEGLIFSTCNRMEILYIPAENCPAEDPDLERGMVDFISRQKGISRDEFTSSLYIHKGEEAIRHLFCVASSLDSMMVGEPQILGQVKQSYRLSIKAKSSGLLLNRLMHKAFSCAKRVRKQTGIGDNAVSISYAAIALANKIFADLSTKKVMLLGAGEMAELAVEHLMANRIQELFVANRTFKNAVSLADKFKGQAVQFEERVAALNEVDIIISSTGATDYVMTAEQVKQAMKKRNHNTLFFIDIAVPRDIDPAINKLSNAYVYDIDDLTHIVESNIQQREKETVKANRIVEEGVVKFKKWLEGLAVVPTIKAINDKMIRIVDLECDRTLAHMDHLGEKDRNAIRRMTRAIASRAIHDPILFLKNTGDHRDDSQYLDMARLLFNLDVNGE